MPTGIEQKKTKVTKLESRESDEPLSPSAATCLKPGQSCTSLNSSFPSFPSVSRYWSLWVALGTKRAVLARKHHLSTMMRDDVLDRNRFVKTCHLKEKEHLQPNCGRTAQAIESAGSWKTRAFSIL